MLGRVTNEIIISHAPCLVAYRLRRPVFDPSYVSGPNRGGEDMLQDESQNLDTAKGRRKIHAVSCQPLAMALLNVF